MRLRNRVRFTVRYPSQYLARCHQGLTVYHNQSLGSVIHSATRISFHDWSTSVGHQEYSEASDYQHLDQSSFLGAINCAHRPLRHVIGIRTSARQMYSHYEKPQSSHSMVNAENNWYHYRNGFPSWESDGRQLHRDSFNVLAYSISRS